MPNEKKTRQPRRASKPKPSETAAPAPKPETPSASEPTAEPRASFAIEQPAAPVAPVEPVVEPAPASIVVEPPVASAEAPADGATPAFPESFRLGQVEGLLHRMPLGEVLLHLEAFEERIATLRDSQVIAELQPRVLATEGRCAPIYFSTDDDGEPEHLIAGVETVAAAMNAGIDCVFVVTVDHGDVDHVQGSLNAMLTAAKPTPEDDFFAQVSAYHK